MALLALNEALQLCHTNRGAGVCKITRILREVRVISSFLHQIAGGNSLHEAFEVLFLSRMPLLASNKALQLCHLNCAAGSRPITRVFGEAGVIFSSDHRIGSHESLTEAL